MARLLENRGTHLCAPYWCSRLITSADEMGAGVRLFPRALPLAFAMYFAASFEAAATGACVVAEGAMLSKLWFWGVCAREGD